MTFDAAAFGRGEHFAIHHHLGAHAHPEGGATFRVWAPRAATVRLVGDPSPRGKKMRPTESGVWTVTMPGAQVGDHYRYRVEGADGRATDKSDPVAFESAGGVDSVISDLSYQWRDGAWMKSRRRAASPPSMRIYEVHLGSWRRRADGSFLGYRGAARALADYASDMGFTHVELMPLAEHPFYGSWGYQAVGYFAPTARYGSPTDLMYLVDTLHRRGIGVILDWVPSHFAVDDHGLGRFDGEALFEHPDRRKGFHPDWNSFIFNYESGPVRSFLGSNAAFWLERYHIDGVRVDAVASMLYLDYSRGPGEWVPNEHGGNENLEAIELLRRVNNHVHEHHPGAVTIAEESTAWPGVTRATYLGGLGFDFKWDMGWMNDTLLHIRRDPVHRHFHHQELTFRMLYAFTERYVLPLSHDEVVHLKGSLLGKQPGSETERLAGLRLLLGYMWTMPGSPLLFMGGELGQTGEWDHDDEVEWGLLAARGHRGAQRWVSDLNDMVAALDVFDDADRGESFVWVDPDDADRSLLSYLRVSPSGSVALVVANFSGANHRRVRLGVPVAGRWKTVVNSDDTRYGGNGSGFGALSTKQRKAHGHAQSLVLDVPPLTVGVFVPVTPTRSRR